MVSREEGCNSNRDTRGAANLVPVIGRQEQAITRQYLHCLNASMFEQRPFVVVWCHELNRRVVIGEATIPCVDELAIILRHNGEVLIASIDTHHVLHRVSVRLGQSTIPVPVSHNINVHKLVHQAWQLDIILEYTRRVLERVVVVIGAIFLAEFL